VASRVCRDRSHRRVVLQRNVAFSAFNGYRAAWSPACVVYCNDCQVLWRTRGKYADDLPDGRIETGQVIP
jgi:hypothetical protein